ncbi:MAG: branched-chain amino acid transaminase [Candidatus Marinimicrobia bacterium]|nr:branched-chain amino acid transaminase [Candidatus Neomarinimicrobiota bacterium]
MLETKYIWMDGKLVPWKDARIHVITHSLHYGSAVFEGIRFYDTEIGPAIFRLEDHTNRLINSADSIKMQIPFNAEEINSAVIETVKANELKNGYIRPLAYYGYGKMGLRPEGAPVNLSIAVWHWDNYLGTESVNVKTSSFMRFHPKSSITTSKIAGNYVNSIFASAEATSEGYDEALLLDYEGKVAEGPGENIFIVSNGHLFTPPPGNILTGITRDSVMTIAEDLGIRVEEKPLTLDEIYDADEAFFTGTAAEIAPIKSLDDHALKNSLGPVTEKIRRSFFNIVNGKDDKYKSWLTVVQ